MNEGETCQNDKYRSGRRPVWRAGPSPKPLQVTSSVRACTSMSPREALQFATHLEMFPSPSSVAIRSLVRRGREVKHFQRAFMNCNLESNVRSSKKQAPLARSRASGASRIRNCYGTTQNCYGRMKSRSFCLGSFVRAKVHFPKCLKTDYTNANTNAYCRTFPALLETKITS